MPTQPSPIPSSALAIAINDPPPELFSALHDRTEGRAFPEFLRSQVEVATPVCRTIGEVRASLIELRRAVVEESARFGLAPIA